MKKKSVSKKPSRRSKEEIDTGTWMPLAPEVIWRCCECGHASKHEYRITEDFYARRQIEVRVTPLEEE